MWTRLGCDPSDRSTWPTHRVHMPDLREFDASWFAPRAWAAICELLGGEERVAEKSRMWRDGLIVNLGDSSLDGSDGSNAGGDDAEIPELRPETFTGWHVDGDFFVHYLDSPEQALLVIPLFSDVVPSGGATVICPRAIPHVAAHLFDHPEGVSPRMAPRGAPDFFQEQNLDWFNALAKRCAQEHQEQGSQGQQQEPVFIEATGSVGDVYLLHPLMLHSASPNPRRAVRIITNPPVAVREPFRFSANGREGPPSIVEQTTIRALTATGRDASAWSIAGPREAVIPERVRIQERMRQEERRRLAELQAAGKAADKVETTRAREGVVA